MRALYIVIHSRTNKLCTTPNSQCAISSVLISLWRVLSVQCLQYPFLGDMYVNNNNKKTMASTRGESMPHHAPGILNMAMSALTTAILHHVLFKIKSYLLAKSHHLISGDTPLHSRLAIHAGII